MTRGPRLCFAAIPTPDEAAAWRARLQDAGVPARLGRSLLAIGNWHQSLSGVHVDPDASTLQRLLRAGESIAADAMTLQFNRVGWSQGQKGQIHCTLHARGRPSGFGALLSAVQQALGAQQLGDDESHRPHITLSYSTFALHPTTAIAPIDWTVRDVVLLKGHGDPYRYDVLGRWPLNEPSNPVFQGDFFASA